MPRMPEGPITIRCTKCGYPYPMTKLQLDVFTGRSMGCMHCGKSFQVFPPPPPPPPDELLNPPDPAAYLTVGAGTEGQALGRSEPGADLPPAAAPSAGPATVPSAVRPGEPEPPVSPSGWLSLSAGVFFAVLTAVAAVVGYAGSEDHAIKAASRSQAPLTLLKVAMVVATIGAVIGSVGVMRARRSADPVSGRRPRMGLAVTGLVVCLAELVLASMLGLLVLPGLNRGLAETHRAACLSNLQTLGYALIARASQQTDGRFPDSLADVLDADAVHPDVMVCPAGEHPPAPDNTSTAEKVALVRSGIHVSYAYLGKGLAMRATGGKRVSTHTVLAYEPAGLHGDPEGFHVLFADGAVVFATKDAASRLREELIAGQNPPPTARVLKP